MAAPHEYISGAAT